MEQENIMDIPENGLLSKSIPEPSLRRLPKYLNLLIRLKNQGREIVSCTHISKALQVDPTLVRKDLSFTGMKGKPKTGFPITGLINSIEVFLNLKNIKEAFMVGAGNLGSALLRYDGFARYGLRIVAAFDNNPDKIGGEINGIKVLGVDKLQNLARRMHIHIGIITVPALAAQEMADMMIESGIKAIWNFSSMEISVPDHIFVINENLANSFAVLSHKLGQIQSAQNE